MIKANELMIGSLLVNMIGDVVDVTSINVSTLIEYRRRLSNENGFSYDPEGEEYEDSLSTGFYPIPITEEWMLKFGFWYIEYRDKWQKDGFYFQLEEPQNQDLSDGYGLLNFDLDPSLKRIKYVHQLQNLYFALMGEELTLK